MLFIVSRVVAECYFASNWQLFAFADVLSLCTLCFFNVVTQISFAVSLLCEVALKCVSISDFKLAKEHSILVRGFDLVLRLERH